MYMHAVLHDGLQGIALGPLTRFVSKFTLTVGALDTDEHLGDLVGRKKRVS